MLLTFYLAAIQLKSSKIINKQKEAHRHIDVTMRVIGFLIGIPPWLLKSLTYK